MSSERPEPQEANVPPLENAYEQASLEREYNRYTENRGKQVGSGEPDLVLDVPVLKVDEIDLEVEDLRAHVSMQAEVADLVKVNVGVDVNLGKVKLEIKGVEAQALLKVRLEKVLGTLERALEAINRNPQILGGTARGTSRDESQAARDADEGADWADQLEDAVDQSGAATEQAGGTLSPVVDETEQATGDLLDETVDGAGRTVQRGLDESGNIAETVLDESGKVVSEEVKGNLADLQIEEEYIDDRGRIVGRARDGSGNVAEEILDEEGEVLDLNMSEEAEDREAGDEGAGEVEATDAARRKADELGVKLSDVEGTGSGGRVLVKDVEKAARRSVTDST